MGIECKSCGSDQGYYAEDVSNVCPGCRLPFQCIFCGTQFPDKWTFRCPGCGKTFLFIYEHPKERECHCKGAQGAHFFAVGATKITGPKNADLRIVVGGCSDPKKFLDWKPVDDQEWDSEAVKLIPSLSSKGLSFLFDYIIHYKRPSAKSGHPVHEGCPPVIHIQRSGANA